MHAFIPSTHESLYRVTQYDRSRNIRVEVAFVVWIVVFHTILTDGLPKRYNRSIPFVHCGCRNSVRFKCIVNLLVEPKCTKESNAPTKQTKAQTYHEHVSQINDHWQNSDQV